MKTSNTETGLNMNVVNFGTLIVICKSHNDKYNPSKPAQKISNLELMHAAAKKVIDETLTAKRAEKIPTHKRNLLFAPLDKTATRILNALDATDADELTVKDASSIVKKILGLRIGDIPEPDITKEGEDATPNIISTSQQSFDMRLEHVAKLIKLLQVCEHYKPNEVDLTVDSMLKYYDTLDQANNAVINATDASEKKLIERNKLLDSDITGLVDTAKDVKKYLKSVFGATSPEYKQVTKLQFRKR